MATTLALGAGLALADRAQAADAAEVSMPGAMKPVTSEALFRMGVAGPAELSLETSKLAQEKATDKQAMEFSGFELTEAIAVLSVLKSLQTPMPPMNEMAKSTLEMLKSAPKGAEFDKAYMTAQLKNHEFLRDHAMDYLTRAAGKTDMPEMHTQHLATLTLAVFKEHVALCQRISAELKA